MESLWNLLSFPSYSWGEISTGGSELTLGWDVFIEVGAVNLDVFLNYDWGLQGSALYIIKTQYPIISNGLCEKRSR